MKNFLLQFLAVLLAAALAGCSNYREIPAGYVGKVLTATGWQSEIREAGQVDIGADGMNPPGNRLVLLEATSVSVKESFGQASEKDGEDHRVLVNNAPVTVDVYVRMMVPADAKRRNGIYSLITPQATSADRVSVITIGSIYDRFAKMDVRSQIRALLQNAQSVKDVSQNLSKYNDLVGRAVALTFERNGVPLVLQNATISNVKQDESVWAAENQKNAALAQVDAIRMVGQALKDNPGYLAFRKWETYEKIAPKIGTFTVIEGAPGGVVVGR